METKKNVLIFIVDDDLLLLKVLEKSISTKLPSVTIKSFQTGEACLHQMKLKPDIVILDYFLNAEVSYAWNGMTILKQIKMISPKTKVIMLSSQDSHYVATKSIENGSYDFISKNESGFVKLNNILTTIIEDINTNKKRLKPYQLMALIVIIIVLLSFIFNQ